MIKVGDKVRVTAYDLHSGFAEGDVVTCIKVGRGGAHKFQGPDGDAWWLETVDYEPIKDGEHIKLGDKVRVVADGVYTKCDVVTCVMVETDDIHLFRRPDGQEFYLIPSRYELIKESEND